MLQPRLLTCSPRCFSRYEDVNVHVELLIVIFFFFFEGKVFDLSFRFLFYSLLFYYKVFSFFIVRSIGLFNGYFLLYLLLFQNSFYYLN